MARNPVLRRCENGEEGEVTEESHPERHKRRRKKWKMIEDILYSRLREYQERIESARENITRALRVSKKPAVCVSAGKDSTVLLSLVLEQKKDALVVFYDSGFEYPETYETLEKLEKHFGIEILIIETSYTMQEIIELEKELGGISPSFVKNVLVYEPSLYVRDEYGVDMFFVGLRAEESKQVSIPLRFD